MHDPSIPCMRTNDIPHLISFVSSEDSQKILILDLYRTTLTVAGPQGRMIGEIRNSRRLGSEISLAGICGCGRHYAGVREGAYVPRGVTLIQWLNSPG